MNERELFLSALAIEDLEAREEYLEAARMDHPELYTRVKALLAAHEKESQFLNTPVAEQISPQSNKSPAPTTVFDDDSSYAHNPKEVSDPLDDASMTTIQDEADPMDPILPGYLQPSTRRDSHGRLGHYEILELIGKGAFGIVLKGFDEKLQRTVAIKVLAPEMAATSPARKRFLREARTSAAVRHDNVVSIFAVENEPTPFLVMEYIPGETLQQRLAGQGPLDLIDVLIIGKQIADGLAAAHEQQLIHRDIKPGNILLKSGVNTHVKITDFGLARTADDASMTQSGTIAGTPLYMAPEQALGQKLDQRADLFSLGSVLYQMVSGRPPFRAPTTVAVLKRVAEETPRPIQEIIPETPGWICRLIENLHAKNPDERYDSAAKVSDLLSYCLNEVQAGRVPVIGDPAGAQAGSAKESPAAKFQPKTKQNWYYMAVPVLLLISLVITELTGLTSFANRQSGIPTIETASVAATTVPQADPTAPALKAETPETVMPAAASPLVTGSKGDDPPVSKSPVKLEPFPLKLTAEPVTHQAGEPLSNFALLQTPPALPGLLSWTINSRIPRLQVSRVLYSPDGKLLATRSDDCTVRLWNASSKELLHVFSLSHIAGELSFSPNGKYLTIGGTGRTRLQIRDVVTGQTMRSFFQDQVGLPALAWDPQRPLLATCNGKEVTVRNLDTGVKPTLLKGHQGEVRFLCWSPDGRELASASWEDGVIIWDATSWEEISRIKISGQLKGLAYAPRGEYLVTNSLQNNKSLLEFWNTSNAELARPAIESERIYTFVLSPTRSEIMELRGGNVVARRDLTTGEILGEYKPQSQVRSIDVSPDGQTLLTGGDEVLAWGLSNGKPDPFFKAYNGNVHCLDWSPTGNLICFNYDHSEQTLSLAEGNKWTSLGQLGERLYFTSDGRYLSTRGANGNVGLFDPETGKRVKTIHINGYCRLRLSPDSRLLAAVTWKQTPGGGGFPLEMIDVETDKPVWTYTSKITELFSIEFSPDGKSIAISGLSIDEGQKQIGHIEVLHVETGQLEKEFTTIVDRGVGEISWSPDGKVIAAREPWITQFYPLQTGDPFVYLETRDLGFNLSGIVHFCRDGKTVVTSKYGEVASYEHTSGFKIQDEIKGWRPVRNRKFNGRFDHTNTAWSPDESILAISVSGLLVAFYEHRQDSVVGTLSALDGADQSGAIAIDKSGHYQLLGDVQEDIYYTILKEDGGQETLSPADFENRFGWKNDPDQFELLKRLAGTALKPETSNE